MHLLDDYHLLRSGGAIGRGCGPLVVARERLSMEDLRDKRVAIPGKMTTANMLLRIQGIHQGRSVEMPFEKIMDAVSLGEVEAGVIIHEGRFTYGAKGLQLVCDLGEWWEAHTGLPLPLGGILIKRALGGETARRLEEMIRRSLLYARANPEEAWPYIRSHAQEMEPEVIRRQHRHVCERFQCRCGGKKENRRSATLSNRLASSTAFRPLANRSSGNSPARERLPCNGRGGEPNRGWMRAVRSDRAHWPITYE